MRLPQKVPSPGSVTVPYLQETHSIETYSDAALIAQLAFDLQALLEQPAGFVQLTRILGQAPQFVQGAGNATPVAQLKGDFQALLVQPAGFIQIARSPGK